MKQLKKETLRSQSQANKSDSASNAGDAFFDYKGSYSEKLLRHFLESLQDDSSDKSQRCNADQKSII